ncbi:hypothetical protein XNC3_1100007 [Xenorhabdus nematophila F1]|nr:hypothetical protein XNC3_1100007 [Xenorhabdus nematophila F1]
MDNVFSKVFINWLEPCKNCEYQGVYVKNDDNDFLCENDDVTCIKCEHHGLIQLKIDRYQNHHFVVSWDELFVKTETN